MVEFKFADIGEGIHEGKLLEWLVKKGDIIENGASLFLVETDKVNAEIPSPTAGTVVGLKASVGDIIKVGDVIVVIDDGKNSSVGDSSVKDNLKEEIKPKIVTTETEEKGAAVVGEITVSNDVIPSFHTKEKSSLSIKKKKVLATPVARMMAKDMGVDIAEVAGSGTNGRVMKKDIKEFSSIKNTHVFKCSEDNLATHSLTSFKFEGPVEEVKLTSVRKIISNAMAVSKQNIPHAVMMDEFDVTELVNFRGEAKKTAKLKGIKLTYLPFIVKALSIALQEFPIFNSTYDKVNEKIIYKKYYNIGVATDTDRGLLVPVIKGADHLSILDVAEELNNIVEKSRDHSLPLDKLQDGTFTITNYGAIGSLFGTPIIKFPEVAILGIGKIVRKPIFADNGELVARQFMPISFGIDHRIIDGDRFFKTCL